MAKGIPALAYLPSTTMAIAASGGNCSVGALKAALNQVEKFQEEDTPNGTYSSVVCRTDSPFSSATWNFTIAKASNTAYLMTFVSEVSSQISTIGRPALTTRRLIDPVMAANTNSHTVRSLKAAVNFVEKLEDLVAVSGTGSTGNGTYTNVGVKGDSPFETFNWTIVKAGNDYTFTAVSGS